MTDNRNKRQICNSKERTIKSAKAEITIDKTTIRTKQRMKENKEAFYTKNSNTRNEHKRCWEKKSRTSKGRGIKGQK